MANSCMVFFRSGACDLDAAARALAECRLTVTRNGDQLMIRRGGSPEFRVSLVREDWVQQEAVEIGAGTPHAAALGKCDARFEISFDSLDEVLDEINTLMEVQGTLQDASRGILFLPWNGELSDSWKE